MKSELASLSENKLAHQVEEASVPQDTKVIRARCVFPVKPDGRFKSRLVAQGFRDRFRLPIGDVSSPVCRGESQKILLCITNRFNWRIHQVDFENAYYNHRSNAKYSSGKLGDFKKQTMRQADHTYGTSSDRSMDLLAVGKRGTT